MIECGRNASEYGLGRRLGVLPRHVPHCSVARVALRQVVCHVLLIFPRRAQYKYHLEHGISNPHLLLCFPLAMSSRSRSRSSSLTISTTTSAPTSPAHSSTTTILQDEQLVIKLETEREEAHFELYRGSDPQDPPAQKNSSASQLPFLPKTNTDPNIVTWDGPEDPENPKNWSFWYRWFITILCTVMTLNVYVPLDQGELLHSLTLSDSTFGSSAPSSSIPTIAHDFHVGREVGNLVTTLFLVGFMLGPSFWGPGSELIGRRPIFVGTLAMYTIFHIGEACANNMTTLLVTRFICGFFAVAPLTNSSGVIADMWDPMNRGIATSVFASSVFLGPVLGPIVGSL